jgi:hydroxymethylpyrimidine kinase / phosphomethylpyrimidine kinase / thiamine-phosphate diphosphorylase
MSTAIKNPPHRQIVWSIAGSDSGAGAGLQADLRAFEAMDVHGCTVVAAITAQNSVGVQLIAPVDATVFEAQLAALADDMPPAAIKVGMIGSVENLRVLVRWIDRLRQINPNLAVVVDPVLGATTGASFAQADLIQAYRDELLPRADAMTPNRAEAALLLNQEPFDNIFNSDNPFDPSFPRRRESTSATMDSRLRGNDDIWVVEQAALALQALGCKTVIITGGDAQGLNSEDYCVSPHAQGWLRLPRVATVHNHGTGCVFASSVAAVMARGFVSMDALVIAKMATTHALRHAYAAGQGAGPVRPRSDFAQHIENLPTFSLPRDSVQISSLRTQSLKFAPLSDANLGLYAVVDSADWVQRVLASGVKTVQLRIKSPELVDIRREVQLSVQYATAAKAQLFINDHWQLAIEESAYGVHLGQEDLHVADLQAIAQAGLRLGLSTHCYWEVCRAWALQPSYIACGPMYATQSKDMPWQPQGTHNVSYWSALLPLPLVAIGGINVERAAQARQAGAEGVAVISAITAAASPEAAIMALNAAIDGAKMRIIAPKLPNSTL